MTRIVLLAGDSTKADAVVNALVGLGGEVAATMEGATTVIFPALGALAFTSVGGPERAEQVASYGDTVAVAILAEITGDSSVAMVQMLTTATRRLFPRAAVTVGFAVDLTTAIAQWVAHGLGRPVAEVPVFRVDVANRRQLLTLLATTVALAHESGPR